MPPSTQQLVGQLKSIIFYHLDNDSLNDALFLAGRLHALDPRNTESIHILALCHQRSGQIKVAHDYTQAPARRGLHLGCAYVFAQTCLPLNRAAEGIEALEKVRSLWESKIHWVSSSADPANRFLPDAAAVAHLLGRLYQANDKTEKAVECYAIALSFNPFMWDAFERLSIIGSPVKPANIFKLSPELASLISSQSASLTSFSQSDEPRSNPTKPLQSYATNNARFPLPQDSDPFDSNSTSNETASGQGPGSFSSRGNMSKALGSGNAAHNSMSNAMEAPPVAFDPSLAPRKPNEPGRVINSSAIPPNAPARKPRAAQPSNIEIIPDAARPRSISSRTATKSASEECLPHEQTNGVSHAVQHKRTVSGSIAPSAANSSSNSDPSIRRSRRLFNQIRPNTSKPVPVAALPDEKDAVDARKSKAIGLKGRSLATATSNVGRVVSGNRKPGALENRDGVSRENRSQNVVAAENRSAAEKALGRRTSGSVRNIEAIQWWLDLLARLGQGLHSLNEFDTGAALKSFSGVPSSQRDTPWVLAMMGKALYEQNSFLEAEKAFVLIRKLVPSSVTDMETYSTVLWHLKKDMELAFLSHELIDVERLSPEAWCTIGNSFSLQRDHVQALKCFRRATQLQPDFAYAFTLQGHEYMANEEYDKAMVAYRRATTADKRHYNGWYGLGKACEKEGRYVQAEKYYKAAVSINPRNAVLRCCIGVVLEKQKRPRDALEHYDLASRLQPTATNAMYRKARVLLNMRQNQDALGVLEVLKTVAPDESNVHFMLGRTHGRLGNKSLAIKHYTIAMNLDPKAAPYLKEQMEGLDQDEGDDDDDDDDEMT